MQRTSSDKRHFIIVGVLTVIGTFVMGFLMKWALPMPLQASSQASISDGVLDVNIWLIAFFFSLVVVFMLYALVVFRRREGDQSDGEHFEGHTGLEIAWTVVPLIIVLFLGYLGVTTLNAITAPQEDELVVQVEGFQWGWTFTYEGDVISQELVLPVNQPALMEMTSREVLHSFWVPEFRVKQDLVPGQTTLLRFTPIEEGEYKLRCAELCGLTHWNMLADVRVVSEEEYTAWITDMIADQGSALADADPAAVSE